MRNVKKIAFALVGAMLSAGMAFGSSASVLAAETDAVEGVAPVVGEVATFGAYPQGLYRYHWVLVQRYRPDDFMACSIRASKLYRERDGVYVKNYKCEYGQDGFGLYALLQDIAG